MAKQKKEDKPEYKEQLEEATKTKASVEEINVGTEGKTAVEVNLHDIIVEQPDAWYKTQVLQLLLEITKELEEIKNEMARERIHT